MELRTQTITVNEGKATIVCREPSGMDFIDQSVIFKNISYNRKSEHECNRAMRFAQAVMRSVVTGDLGISWADIDAPQAELRAAFDAWQRLNVSDLAAWEMALHNTSKPLAE